MEKDNERKRVLAFNGKVYVPRQVLWNREGICKQCALYGQCIKSDDNPFLSEICRRITRLEDRLVEAKGGKR